MRKPRLIQSDEVEFKLRRKVAWLNRLPRLVAGKTSRRQLFEAPARIYGRKSVVKASYVRNAKGHKFSASRLMAHAKYLERGHGHEKGHREPGFDAGDDRVDIKRTARNWALAKDRIHWRIILSPDDVERIDLRQHARDVVAQMERDLGTKLRWVGIIHDNTDHRHVHLMIRGVRDVEDERGKAVTLTMDREYVSRGIREISQKLIERQLGPRTEREYLEVRAHGIEAERWTEIDRSIERKLKDNVADYSYASYLSDRSRPRVQQEMGRLAYLQGRGLAHSLGGNRWLVNDECKSVLKELQLGKDRIKDRARRREQGREREMA